MKKLKDFNKEQLELLRALWKQYKEIEDIYYMKINELEEIGKTNLDIDLEFFFTDGGCVGIGDINREYKLVQTEKLETSTLEMPRAVVNEDI